jgi:ABC-type transport system involved in multi-copper enzyme maturation permease subunit
MMSRIGRALIVECIKAMHFRFTWIGPLLIIAGAAAYAAVENVSRDGAGDYSYIANATSSSLGLLGFLILLIYSTNLLSHELSTGVLRTVLVLPLRRWELLAAKLALGIAYAVLLDAAAAATAWGIAAALGDLDGVVYGTETLYANSEMATAYGASLAMALLPQIALVAFALFVAAAVSRPAMAIATAIGTVLIADVLKYPLGFDAAFFTTYLDSAWRPFIDRAQGLDAELFYRWPMALAACLPAIVLFAGGAGFLLHRKDLGK